jgi:hypothetical protein
MTQALNWADAGGEAAAKNQAQAIRQNRVLRRFSLRSADRTMLPLLLLSRISILTSRPTDNGSEPEFPF